MYAYLAVALLSAALSGAGVWKVQSWRHGAQEKERLEAIAEKAKFDRRAIDTAAVGHEQDKAKIRTEFKTIYQEVERVVEKPFYVASEQCLDDDGLRALTTAIGAANAASQPASAVPAAEPTHWWQPRRSAPLEH